MFNNFFYNNKYEFLFSSLSFFGSIIILMYYYPLFIYIFRIEISNYPYIFLPFLPILLVYMASIVFFLSIDIYGINYCSIADNCYFICDYKSMRDAVDLYLEFLDGEIHSELKPLPYSDSENNCNNNYISCIVFICIALAGISIGYYKFG